jgi:multiple sugar transport system ATP-binding protein
MARCAVARKNQTDLKGDSIIMADIELRHINKQFDDVWAVRDLNLKIRDKEFLTLLGPSGCGKSTTLSMIAGLEHPTAGDVFIDGKPVTNIPAAQRDIAMVFQNYALYPHMTVYRNMAFGLEIRKTPKRQIDSLVRKAAETLGITDLLERSPAQLSGGQRQRVALGRALVRDPRAFLLDEPLSNLDPVLRVQMRAELKMLFNKLRTTAVFVTHDQAEAMTMSDRIAIMNQGVLQQIDTPRNIYNAPKNEFVAGFVGSPPMNLFKAMVNDAGKLSVDQTFIEPPGDVLLSHYAEQPITVGIRPEDVRPSDSGDDIRAVVEVVEDLGALKIAYMRFQGELIAMKLTSSELGNIHANDIVNLALPSEKIYLFDPDSSNVIRYPDPAYVDG